MKRRLLVRASCALTTILTLATCQLSSAQAANFTGGVTAITPVMKTTAGFCPQRAGAGKSALCSLDIRVSHVSGYGSFVSCLGCGAGRWGAWSKVGPSWEAKGTHPIAAHASVLLVVTKPGYVGRYLVYRPVAVNTPHAGLRLVGQGCIAADVAADSVSHSFHQRLRNLPTTPCKAPKHLTAYVYTAGTNELASTTSHALIYGRASVPMWLTVGETSSGNCRAGGPLSYTSAERNKIWWYTWHVKGEFEEGFRTHARRAAGDFCVYMQTGGQYQHFADGWVAQEGFTEYDTGDVLTGPAATTLSAAGATTVTLSGNAPRTETLESFDSLTPCPEFSETAQHNGFGGSTMQVSGAFTETLTTATFPQSGYICSYLHVGGVTVAMATDQLSVTGTQFKDQANYAETATQAITPLSDPVGNTGAAGTAIAPGQTVYVRCILNGMGLAPFDPIWYELASSPWGDAYYAPAYAFYNNGQTSGVVNGPRWDSKVPFCEAL